MPPILKPRVPSYRLHKARGLAVVTLSGRNHYLGPYGTQASRIEYDRLISQWTANGRRPLSPVCAMANITISEICAKYWQFAQEYYLKHGEPTSEQPYIKLAMRPLETYANTPLNEFGPAALNAVRNKMIDMGWARTTINGAVARIKRMFKWAVSQELVAHEIYAALTTLSGLRKGRSTAKESSPVTPVRSADLQIILPFLSRPVRGIVGLMQLTGMRPGEARIIRGRDLDMSSAVWIYTPATHKTEHRGRLKEIPIGPRAQLLLSDYLVVDPDQHLFRPIDVHKSGGRRRGKTYGKDALRRAIERACERAGVEVFSPNQIRHTYATEIRREFGLDACRSMLGHTDTRTTEIYAERDRAMSCDIALKVG